MSFLIYTWDLAAHTQVLSEPTTDPMLPSFEGPECAPPKGCECGAGAVGVPNFQKGHSDWCPVWEEL